MSTAKLNEAVQTPGLYQPEFEHDNCGIGAVVNIKGVKSHGTVENALKIVENLEHRAGKDESCFRFHTSSSPKPVSPSASF